MQHRCAGTHTAPQTSAAPPVVPLFIHQIHFSFPLAFARAHSRTREDKTTPTVQMRRKPRILTAVLCWTLLSLARGDYCDVPEMRENFALGTTAAAHGLRLHNVVVVMRHGVCTTALAARENTFLARFSDSPPLSPGPSAVPAPLPVRHPRCRMGVRPPPARRARGTRQALLEGNVRAAATHRERAAADEAAGRRVPQAVPAVHRHTAPRAIAAAHAP